MAKINAGRVVLGGLLAGVVVNAFEWVVNGVILKEDWEKAVQALGRTMGDSAIAIFVLLGFLTGIAAVWLYAAIRPRYGPGPKTALCAGFAMWVLAYVLPTISYAPLGLFPRRMLVIGLIVGLVEILAGTQLGAWLYKEET